MPRGKKQSGSSRSGRRATPARDRKGKFTGSSSRSSKRGRP